MKKKLFGLLVIVCLSVILTGCHSDIADNNTNIDKKQMLECLEQELGGFLVTEKDSLESIPLNSITDKTDHIIYYSGVKANEDNMYLILETSVSEWEVMRDVELYFSKKYSTYQSYDIPYQGIKIYFHNFFNDVNFDDLKQKCMKSSVTDGKSLPSKTSNKLDKTNRIVIKSNDQEVGIIRDGEVINEILEIISNSKQYGDTFLCDGYGFEFEMYSDDNKIDTIYVWGDGNRLIPKSLHNGCSYYSISQESSDLRKIIEENSNYIFLNLLDYSELCEDQLELIYEDEKYYYYFPCQKSDQVFLHFELNYLTMPLKYALQHHYINPEYIERYDSDLLIKVEK